jgi:hypothetical protein
MTIVARLLTATSGYIVEGVGWEGFFALTIVVAAPALVLWRWLPDGIAKEASADQGARKVKPIHRTLAKGAALAFGAMSVWKFTEGNWKLGIGLIVPALAFLAYATARIRSAQDLHARVISSAKDAAEDSSE